MLYFKTNYIQEHYLVINIASRKFYHGTNPLYSDNYVITNNKNLKILASQLLSQDFKQVSNEMDLKPEKIESRIYCKEDSLSSINSKRLLSNNTYIINVVGEIALVGYQYENFVKNLLDDSLVCSRINEIIHYSEIMSNDFNFVKVINTETKEFILVDPQGYNYARYVAIPVKQKN